MTININKLFTPVHELNALIVNNIEKLVAFQLKTIKEGARVGVESLKGATAVRDLEGLKVYIEGQTDVAKGVAEGIVADTRKVVDLGQSYTKAATEIVESAEAIS